MKTLVFICFFLLLSSLGFSQELEKHQVLVTSTSTFILNDDKSMNDFKAMADEYYQTYNKAFDGVIKFNYAIGDRGTKKSRFMQIMVMDLEIRDAIWPCEDDNESEGCVGNGMYVKIMETNELAELNNLWTEIVKSWTNDDEMHTDWIVGKGFAFAFE